VVTIGFEQTTYSIYEGFNVELCVNLSSGGLAAERVVVVTLSTDDVLGSGVLCEWFENLLIAATDGTLNYN
jgi:hypothetical protein